MTCWKNDFSSQRAGRVAGFADSKKTKQLFFFCEIYQFNPTIRIHPPWTLKFANNTVIYKIFNAHRGAAGSTFHAPELFPKILADYKYHNTKVT